MDETFRWGLIGPGIIAEKFADAMQVVDGNELRAVASRSRERGSRFAEKWSIPVVYESYERLVGDEAIDAVYIATPHRFHFEQSLLCLNHDKAVLCEKPLTVNADEARRLIETSRERRVFLLEALWTRFLPIYREAREWIEGGRIGDPTFLTSRFCYKVGRDPDWRLLNPDLAGGTLLDMGVYCIALSQWAFAANPDSFAVESVLGETGVDEMTAVSAAYPGDRLSQFTTGFQVTTKNTFTVVGTEGSIHFGPRFWDCTRAVVTVGDREDAYERSFDRNGFEYQIQATAAAVRRGEIEHALMPHADSLANMEFMDQIRSAIGLTYPFE